jgi:hypothetical protein
MISESIRAICGGRVPGGRGAEVTEAEVGGRGVAGGGGGGGAAPICAMGVFSLFSSGGELELAVGGSVGDDGKGAKKWSDSSESGACGMDEGIVAIVAGGCGGGGGGGRSGMGNSS